ncbi:MAG TPA: tetratricopeptide repeat protein [Tepidisphaeraceae bacterium]|jgi:tetratricopeptide (TPR) repeat protein|nr:tetratricopeptide repeat protein [Tepidisphaeraceae bacterium]
MDRRIALLIAAVTALPSSAFAADPISRQTLPYKWVEPLMPEAAAEPEYREYYDALDKAKAQLAAGQYRRVLVTLRGAGDVEPATMATVRAKALSALGRHAEALASLDAIGNDSPPAAIALRAMILIDLGQPRDAVEIATAAIAKHPTAPRLHAVLGNAHEAIGDLDAALRSYAWFTQPPQDYLNKFAGNPDAFEDAEELTVITSAIDRWAALSGAYRDNVGLHGQIYDMFTRAYDVIDRTYTPARVAAAAYAMSHDEDGEAQQLLQTAMEANPNDPASLNLMGRLAVSVFNFDAADAMILRLRDVNDASATADLLESRNLLQQRRPKEAEVPIRRVLAAKPRNLEAMGLLAATYALRLEEAQMTTTLKEVEQIDPDNATAYLEVADQLGAMRQYPRAAAMYEIAIERAPNWTDPRNGLGLLYTQSGDEDDARRVLEGARALDPFNARTTNYLRLLDEMEGYAVKETPHFIIMYDAKADPIIPEYFGDYLESIYKEVTGNFQHEPKDKTIIEVFPTHDGFSVRTTGSPWIGTVGASTGRVIAMVSPRKGEKTMGPFNWAGVLRHEFTHTVTLAATDNRIQHWMTEGLAVLEENVPLRWEWVPMLYAAVQNDTLFRMDELTWGFVRPKKPSDRQQAYAQSFWVCQYIQEKYGHDTILKMLEAFRNAERQEDVFPRLTGRSMSQFFEDFRSWAQQQTSTWGYDEKTSAKVDVLRAEGEALIKAKQYAAAVPVWEEIAALRPMDALPHQRLAGLFVSKAVNQPEKAVEHFLALHQVELKDNRYAKRIARIYRDTDKLPEAQKFALESVYVNPYDLDAHKLLREIAEKAGDEKTVERQNRSIAAMERLSPAEKPEQE